jgi:carbonic anhydrase
MKALMNPEMLEGMPNVAAWLRHSHAAESVVSHSYPVLAEDDRVRAASLENVVIQLAHLRTHPSVAAGLARGQIALHGWFVDIHAGVILALDGETGRFAVIGGDRPLPVAVPALQRRASDFEIAEAAE